MIGRNYLSTRLLMVLELFFGLIVELVHLLYLGFLQEEDT